MSKQGALILDKLISCSACAGTLATTAVQCPHCGAANSWTHPAMQSMLNALDSGIEIPDKYEYQREGPLLMITTNFHKFKDPTKSIVIALLLGMLFCFFDYLDVIGVVLMGFAFVRLIWMVMFGSKADHWLALDYSQDEPTWRSNNEKYFLRVLTKFDLLSRNGS